MRLHLPAVSAVGWGALFQGLSAFARAGPSLLLRSASQAASGTGLPGGTSYSRGADNAEKQTQNLILPLSRWLLNDNSSCIYIPTDFSCEN